MQIAPKLVEITFGETPDPKLSTITVINSAGLSVDAGPTVVVPGHPLELEVPLQHIGNGVYTVTWKTVSEVDGHLATGAYAFGVGVSAASANAHASRSVVSPPPSVLAVVGRWLFFVGVDGHRRNRVDVPARVGGSSGLESDANAGGRVDRRRARRCGGRRSTARSRGSCLQLAVFNITRNDRGRANRGDRGHRTGSGCRIGGARRRKRTAVALAGIGAAASMWVDVAASHAGAQAPVAVNLFAQWAHIVAGGIWIGGLLVLIVAVRGQPSELKGRAVRRFSTIAGVAIVLVALTGTFRAVIEIGSIGQLFATAFGVLVIVKVALFLVLAALGAINRYRNVPRAAGVLRGLRRVGSTEVVIGAAVVLVAAALVNVAPPVASTAAASTARSSQLVVTGSDFATTVKVRLAVSPGTAGFNNFVLRVTDYDTGATVHASFGAARVHAAAATAARPVNADAQTSA